MIFVTTIKNIIGLTDGRVTCLNWLKEYAPSIAAASYKLSSMPASPDVKYKKLRPEFSHTVRTPTLSKAHFGSANQLIFVFRIIFKIPTDWFSITPKTRAIPDEAMAIGKEYAAEKSLINGKFTLHNKAVANPRRMPIVTTIITYTKVTFMLFQNAGD